MLERRDKVVNPKQAIETMSLFAEAGGFFDAADAFSTLAKGIGTGDIQIPKDRFAPIPNSINVPYHYYELAQDVLRVTGGETGGVPVAYHYESERIPEINVIGVRNLQREVIAYREREVSASLGLRETPVYVRGFQIPDGRVVSLFDSAVRGIAIEKTEFPNHRSNDQMPPPPAYKLYQATEVKQPDFLNNKLRNLLT